jgi:5-methylcytosine-specific restriction protein B
MLIENDKRSIEAQLLYSGEKFSVPENVYLIGMMNTADRSLAMLDYALRRRFAFFDMRPAFESEGFRKYRRAKNNQMLDSLIDCVVRLNVAISEDEALGDNFCIGHSYFCELENVNEQVLNSIVEYEIIPLLKEYWFDESSKLKDWSANLRSAIK